jgi:carboxylesterase
MTNELCVLVHGFTGSPEEVEPLARALRSAGYDVVIPVLYGHCGSKDDLKQATASAWIQSVQPIVMAAVKTQPVHLIGFSMGAMVSAIIANKFPVSTLTMLSPAVYYVGPKQMFRQIANVIKETWDKGGAGQSYLRQRIEKISQTPLQSVKQFRRLIQIGKTALPKVNIPICIIQGENDEIVEPRGADFVFSSVASTDKELHYLPKCDHMICHSVESDQVNDWVLNFLANHKASENPPTQAQAT